MRRVSNSPPCSRRTGSSPAAIISSSPTSFSIQTARCRTARKRAGAWCTSSPPFSSRKSARDSAGTTAFLRTMPSTRGSTSSSCMDISERLNPNLRSEYSPWTRAVSARGAMMLSILVCHSYFLRLDQKQLERGKPYPPLATLQVAAMLRKAGHEVAFFNAMLAEGTLKNDRRLRATEPQIVLFYEDTFNFLSKMCLGTMRSAACEMIGSAHRSGARVIAAGPDVSDAPGPYLRAGADLALIGEGLSALLELLPRLDAQPDARTEDLIGGLAGVASLSQGKVITAGGAKVLPMSHYDGFAADRKST